ncbi:hypothetical protein V8B97DRAFT_1919726 [Scleroderma yunnanense]
MPPNTHLPSHIIDPMLLAANTSTEDEDTHQLLLTKLTNELDALPKRKKQKMIILKVNEAKYELIGRKLACMLNPFGSPQTVITIRLKVEAGCEADLNIHTVDDGKQWTEGDLWMTEQSQVFAPPIPKTEDKSMCRFNHPDIVYILCPHKKLDSLEEDPDIIIGALQEGQFNTAKQLFGFIHTSS